MSALSAVYSTVPGEYRTVGAWCVVRTLLCAGCVHAVFVVVVLVVEGEVVVDDSECERVLPSSKSSWKRINLHPLFACLGTRVAAGLLLQTPVRSFVHSLSSVESQIQSLDMGCGPHGYIVALLVGTPLSLKGAIGGVRITV